MAGHGIHDVWDSASQLSMNGHSQYSWVETLGKLLKIDVVNQAVAGSSNKEISYLVQNFEYQPGDRVIINWTFKERSCIIGLRDGHAPHYHLSIHYKDDINLNWQDYHTNNQNLDFESIMAITSADWVLENQNVMRRHLFLREPPGHVQYILPHQYREWLAQRTIPVKFDWYNAKRGCDGSHPDLAAYTNYAHQVYEWIKENEDINKWQ